MEKRDIVSSLFLLALGGSFASGSFAHSIWSRYGPGPGFFPLFFGIVLAVLGALLLVDGTNRLRKEKRNKTGTDAPPFANLPRIAVYLLCCGCVYLAMRPLGFLITVFLFLVAAFPLAGQKSFGAGLAVAALVSVSMFLLFLGLNVPLPFGLLRPLAGLWGS